MASDPVEIVRTAQGGAAVANLARQFGLSQDQVEHVLSVLLPQLAKGFERNLLDRNGVAGVIDALSSGHHERYARDAAILADRGVAEDGNKILGHLLGSKTGSRQLAAYGAQETGVPAETLKQMLPYLAAMMMGGVATQSRQAFGDLGEILRRLPQQQGQGGSGGGGGWGDLGEILRRLPGGGGQGAPSGGGGGGMGDIGDILRRLPGGAGAPGPGGGSGGGGGGGFDIPGLPPGGGAPPPAPAGNPDQNRQKGGGAGRGGFELPPYDPNAGGTGGGGGGGGGYGGGRGSGGSPLPLPDMGGGAPFPGGGGGGGDRGNNPYGDLGDIIRQGGANSGILASIVRSVLGSILGRSAAPGGGGSGWLGWIVKLLIARFGWRIVQAIFRGLLRR
jgi:hypothetical protein